MGSLGLPTTLAPSDIVELIPAILHSIGGKISTSAVEQGLTVFPEFKKWLDSQSFDTRVFLKNQFSGDESALLTFDADYDTLSLGASARVSDEMVARYQTKVDLFKARLVSPCFAVGKPCFANEVVIRKKLEEVIFEEGGRKTRSANEYVRHLPPEVVAPVASKLLFRVAQSGNAVQGAKVLSFCVQSPTWSLDVEEFCKLMRCATYRLPMQAKLVRLLLQLAIPVGGKPMPIVPPNYEDDDYGTLILVKDAEADESFQNEDKTPTKCFDIVAGSGQVLGFTLDELLGRVRCPDYAASEYFAHFMILLQLEVMQELHEVERRLRLPLSLQRRLKFMGDGFKVIATNLPEGMLIFDREASNIFRRTNFRSGDQVSLSREDPLQEGVTAVGMIQDIRSVRPFVELQKPFSKPLTEEGAKTGTWRLDKVSHLALYDRQLVALRTLATTYRSPPEEYPRVWDLILSCGGYGRCPSTGSTASPRMDKQALVKLAVDGPQNKKPALEHILQGYRQSDRDSNLDQFQRAAIATGIGSHLTVIQGPPGTGKTQVSVEILHHWVKDLGLSSVMAVSHNHTAVDNLAERLHDLGLRVVRLGEASKVMPKLLPVCLFDGSTKSIAAMASADIICTTNISAGKACFARLQQEIAALLVDEAAQATELSTLVPIVNSRAKQVVILGDHRQLPPLVTTAEGYERGGALSLFQRLAENGLPLNLLQRQYRMHPLIAEFSSQSFYDGRIETGCSAEDRPPPAGFDWPSKVGGVAFVPCTGQQQSSGKSLVNHAEARLVAQLLEEFLAAGELSPKDIGIITPYSAQCRLLRQIVEELFASRFGEAAQGMLRDLQVSSVDGFQGREKELIIVSAVRSHGIGFLRDEKRLNVMLTRARRGFIFIGHAENLRQDPMLARYLDWAQSNSLVKSDLVLKTSAGDQPISVDEVQSAASSKADVLAEPLAGEQPADVEMSESDISVERHVVLEDAVDEQLARDDEPSVSAETGASADGQLASFVLARPDVSVESRAAADASAAKRSSSVECVQSGAVCEGDRTSELARIMLMRRQSAATPALSAGSSTQTTAFSLQWSWRSAAC